MRSKRNLLLAVTGVLGVGMLAWATSVVAGPAPGGCESDWPVVTLDSIGGGQSAPNNEKVTHKVTGNLVGGLASYGPKAGRLKFCTGSSVTAEIFDSVSAGGSPFLTTLSGNISCSSGPGATCTVASLNGTEKYKASSEDGKDTDRIALLPSAG